MVQALIFPTYSPLLNLYFYTWLQVLCGVLSFHPAGSRSCKPSQLSFIWMYLNFCNLEGQICQTEDSWLTGFFSFSALCVSDHCLQPPKFLMRNLLVIWWFIHVRILFLSCCFHNALFFFPKYDYNVSWHEYLWVYVFWSSFCFLDQTWGVFSHYFFRHSLCPFFSLFSFQDSHDAHAGPLHGVP